MVIWFFQITEKSELCYRNTTRWRVLQLEQHQRSYTKCSWACSIHWMQCGHIRQQPIVPSLLVCGHFWFWLHWLPCLPKGRQMWIQYWVPIFLILRNHNNWVQYSFSSSLFADIWLHVIGPLLYPLKIYIYFWPFCCAILFYLIWDKIFCWNWTWCFFMWSYITVISDFIFQED